MKKPLVLSFGLLIIIGATLASIKLHSGSVQPVENAPTVEASSSVVTLMAPKCLSVDQRVEYEKSSQDPVITQPKDSSTTVVVLGKESGKIITSFQIDNINRAYHSVETKNCHFYVIRNMVDHFGIGLWSYDYAGKAQKLVDFAGVNQTGNDEVYFQYDFRVSPDEKYLGLIGDTVVIKDLNDPKTLSTTSTGVFVLPINDIEKQHPDVVGNLGFESGGWSSNGKYLWAEFFEGANELGFVRINTEDWSYQVFKAPPGMLGGDAVNFDSALATYMANGAPWTGDADLDQQFRDQALANGQVSSFYIYNFLTKKSYLVATTTDPTYYFLPKWLSDNKLQYVPPSGVTSTYVVSP